MNDKGHIILNDNEKSTKFDAFLFFFSITFNIKTLVFIEMRLISHKIQCYKLDFITYKFVC